MKTTIFGGFLVVCIVAGIMYRADLHGPTNKSVITESIQATAQSISNKVLCPLSEEIFTGQKPIFTYRDENTWHPLQENMPTLQVVAWINNNKAICKYFWSGNDKVFAIILPWNFGTCILENDDFAWFTCD